MLDRAPKDLAWLVDTYWYCAAETVPAIRTQSRTSLEAVADQTVWWITGARHGYFWGAGSALVTPAGQVPDVAKKGDFTFYGSITPDRRVHITFFLPGGSTIGTGILVVHHGQVAFEMQMSSGNPNSLVVHWAYMLQVTSGDPAWNDLPGTNGATVEDLLSGLEAPQVLAPS